MILAIALAMVLPSMFVLASTGVHDTSTAAATQEYVMIELKNPHMKNLLKSAGIEIVEDYGDSVMAKITSTQRAKLGPQFRVKDMPDRNLISFNHYTFDVTKGEPNFPANLKITKYKSDRGYYIVKFYGPVKQEWKSALERMGAHIFSPIYSNAFLVRMDAATKAKVESMPQVSYVGIYQPAYKISKEVSEMSGPNCHIKILTFPEARNAVVAKLGRLFHSTGLGHLKLRYDNGAPMSPKIANGRFGYIEAVVDSSLFDDIAKLPGVQYIEKYDQPRLMNDLAHSLEQSDNTATTGVGAPNSLVAGQADPTLTPIWAHGLFGQNMVVGLSDSGLALEHYAFYDSNYSTQNSFPTNTYVSDHRKVVRYETFASTGYDNQPTSGTSDHGTHVACSIAGYDNPVGGTLAYDGGAPAAKISFSDIGKASDSQYVYPPNNLSETWDPARLDGARTYSQSWGGSWSSQYSGDMVTIDQYLYDHPDFLMTWAAGNQGSALNTLDNQAESKNGISVAAAGASGSWFRPGTEDGTDIATFSSRGPTFDNRLKPDITAPGVAVDSADSSNLPDGSTSMDGTSMATPNANWACALIYQYFLDGWYPTGVKTSGNEMDPSGALVKAVLLSGAVEMTGTGAQDNPYNGNGGYPSVDQGWGFINLNNSLYFSGDTNTLQVIDSKYGLNTGQYIEYKYSVVGTSDPLVVTLDWYDYPATPGATQALVNDYDLTVIDPSGNTYKGNVFTGSNPGYTPSNTGAYDHVNNVEEVKIVSGQGLTTGIWTVRVSAYNIQVGPQPFALVVNGDLDTGYGQVYLDNSTYSETATAHIRVEDTNAAGYGSVTVTVTSANTGDSENVTCTEVGSGVFTGQITFTLSASSSDDGVLSVTDKDVITASYTDDNPVHTSTANATIDAKGPVISNVKATDISMFSAKIVWNTDEKANAKVYYGTSPTNLNLVASVPNTYTTNPSVVLKGLTGNTLYYYDVESADIYGHVTRDDNGGSHYTFTTPGKGDILLVVSDDGTTQAYWNMTRIIDSYKWAMDQYGWTYNVWRTWEAGQPPLSTLQDYLVVIWQVGWEYYPPFNDSERQLIKDYNDGGGRLWVVSHDVMWAFGDSQNSQFYSAAANTWMKSQMKADWNADPSTISTIYGISGDPISGAYTGGITYQQFRSGGAGDEVASVAAGGTTTYVWTDGTDNTGVKWISSAANGTAGVGVWGGTPSKFTGSFWEWSNLISNSTVEEPTRAEVLNKTLVWLIGNDHPDVTVTYPNGGEVLTTNTVTVTWDVQTYGGASISSTSLYYSDNGGQAWYLISDTIGSATSYTWDISTLPNGNDYMVKVVVTDNENPALSGYDLSDSTFTINRAGGDTLGPVTVAGSVTAEPIPAVQGETIWYNATIDDSNKGNSNIVAAEYFIDSTGADGTGTAMSAADGSFDSPIEDVTWSGICNLSPGTHTLYVHGQDAAGNWGSFESVNFTVNPGTGQIVVNITTGWNLISLPWLNTPTAITDALSGISWDRAMVYENGVWKTYDVNRLAKYNLGFPTVDNTVGIWVHATSDGTLSGSDANVGPTNITMGVGWNLVGYPSNTVRTVSDALSTFTGSYDYVQMYDPTTGQMITLASTDSMKIGYGYWIHVTAAGTWTVNW